MLMVIFGAGASYDSAQAFPPQFFPDPWRPPLADELFRDPNQVRGHIVQKYLKLDPILTHLRQPGNGRSVEEELEWLQAQAIGQHARERLKQFAAVRYYLRDLLFDVSDQWHAKTSGATNYPTLIDELLRLNKSGEAICLVTFNYDLLLDRALLSFDYQPQNPADEFMAHPILKLFKPHGSVDLARFVQSPAERLPPQQLIQYADALKLTNEFKRFDSISEANSFLGGPTFPAIAIPFQNKTQDTFEWPPSHRTHLEQLLPHVRKILIIGWQAKEAHFLQLLASNLRTVTHLMVVGRDHSDSDRILSSFAAQVGNLHSQCHRYTGQQGFTHFVVNHEGQEFLGA